MSVKAFLFRVQGLLLHLATGVQPEDDEEVAAAEEEVEVLVEVVVVEALVEVARVVLVLVLVELVLVLALLVALLLLPPVEPLQEKRAGPGIT